MDQNEPITIGDLYPELSSEEQQEAQKNVENYLRTVKKIYDRLQAEGKLEDVLLRAQWEKRSRKTSVSQNIKAESDDTSTTTRDSNEFTS